METRQITSEEADIILTYDENHFRDVKAIEIAPAKLSRTVSAFANTAGGELFVGVAENGDGTRTWSGFENIEAANGLVQALEGLSPMGNLYSAQFLSGPGREGLVLHLAVRKTREIINATDGTAYIRRGAQKLPVTGDEALKRLQLDKAYRHSRMTRSTYPATRSPIPLQRLSLSCHRFRGQSRMSG
jgi:ATP-dependent DNA helicase RecG